jgi:hypothetical protein
MASIRLDDPQADRLRRLARKLAAQADRDLTLSEVLARLLDVGEQHADQLAAAVKAGTQ